MVELDLVTPNVFPGPDDLLEYDVKHADALQYSSDEIAIRVRIIQVGPDKWHGGVDARYGDAIRRSCGLHSQLPAYPCASEALIALLREVASDLAGYGKQGESKFVQAKAALEDTLARVSPEVRDAVDLI